MPMRATPLLLLAAAGVAALGLGAAADSPPTLMSPADYGVARRALDGELRRALGRCRGNHEAARALCRAEARADDRVRRAELYARYRGTVGAAAEIRTARVKARFDRDRARCEFGSDPGPCVLEARAARERDLALARDPVT